VWPETHVKVISANPGLLVMAALALAALYRWPAVVAVVKPTLALFSLVGVKSRGWWVGLMVLGLASLPFLALTLAYPAVALNAQSPRPFYSVWDLPLVALPLIAWAGARDHGPTASAAARANGAATASPPSPDERAVVSPQRTQSDRSVAAGEK
jgi:hypothetical protein